MLPLSYALGQCEGEGGSFLSWLQAEMCWAAAEGSQEMSKGWAEELLQVQGLTWRASLSFGFGLRRSSRFRVWSEELLQSMVVWGKRASG